MELSEELKAKLEAVGSVEEAVALLNENGIDITEEELNAAMKDAEGELDETALDDVAGGFGVALGFAVATAVYLYLKGKRKR